MSAGSMTNLGAQMNERLKGPSLMIWLCAGTVWLFIVWAAFAWVDEIVRADGSFISSSRPQIIQNLEGGILAELLVKEGDEVMKDDVLARLHGTQFQSSVDDLAEQITGFEVQVSLILPFPPILRCKRRAWSRRKKHYCARVNLISFRAAMGRKAFSIKPQKSWI
jgi:hypothetical protein